MVVALTQDPNRFYGMSNPFSILNRMDRRRPLSTHLSLVEPTAQKVLSLRRQDQTAEKDISSKTVAALTVTDLSVSFARNALRVAPGIGPAHPIVQGLGYASSGIGLLLGSTVTIGSNVVKFHKSQKIGDGEGMRQAGSQILSGAITTNAVTLSLFHQIVLSSLAGLGIAANVFFGLGSLVTIGIAGWSIYRSSLFYFKIDGHSDSQHLNEKERVVKTLKFLKEKIAPTEKEKETIVKKIDKLHPNWSLEEKLSAVKQKMVDLAEVKCKYVQRRTSPGMAERVLKEIDNHLERSNNPLSDSKALDAAKELIEAVKKETKKKLLFTTIVAVTSLIALTALILSTFFSLGIVPFVLYTVSSAIALGILVCPLLVDKLAQTRSAAMQDRAQSIAPLVISSTSH